MYLDDGTGSNVFSVPNDDLKRTEVPDFPMHDPFPVGEADTIGGFWLPRKVPTCAGGLNDE